MSLAHPLSRFFPSFLFIFPVGKIFKYVHVYVYVCTLYVHVLEFGVEVSTGSALQEVCECVSAREKVERGMGDIHRRAPGQYSLFWFILCSGALVGSCGRALP